MIIDIVAHLLATDYGHDIIYRVVNRLCKFMYFIPYKYTVSAAGLANLFLANVVAHYGMPASIVSNHDLWFTSHFWRSLISALGCKHFLSMAFHPKMDGLGERMHRSIE